MTILTSRPAQATTQSVLLRHLATEEDYAACFALQKTTWGESFHETVPSGLLKVSQRMGGIVAGAFDHSGELLGFVFGLTGYNGIRPVHWSHMLAVRADARDHGIGRQLKEFQRSELSAAGIQSIYWTYDPLVARNAHLNINRLGVEVIEYVRDMYGPTGSELHALGTDRLVVHWDLTVRGPHAEAVRATYLPVRGADGDLPDDNCIGIEIPGDIAAVQEVSLDIAMRWRASTRRAFLHYLGAGYRVRGFRQDETARSFYLLEKS